MHLIHCTGLALFAALAPVAPLAPQSTTQLVGTGSVVYPYSRALTFVGEASPAVLIEGSPDFWEIGLDAGVEYTVSPSIDLLAYQFLSSTTNSAGSTPSSSARAWASYHTGARARDG